MMARSPRAPVPRSSAWSAMVFEGLVLEDQFDAVELEHLLVLLDEGVLRRGQDLDQRGAVQVGDGGDDGQPADEFRDQPELEQVLRHDLAVGIRVVLDLVERGAEADALAPGPRTDDVLEPREGAGHDEEHVGGVDLDEFLVRVLASALRRDRGHGALEDLQERLLHALARNVPGNGGVLALARDLVDLIDVDDALLGLFDVIVGGLDEFEEDVLNVLADVAGLGQGRGVGDGERDVEAAGEGLGQVGLAAAGGADQQDVGLGDLDVVVVARRRRGCRSSARGRPGSACSGCTPRRRANAWRVPGRSRIPAGSQRSRGAWAARNCPGRLLPRVPLR